MINLPTYPDQRQCIWHEQHRPYIILKWAETADGFVAPAHDQAYWISNAEARRLVHRWRSEEAAIWVGKRTYQADNPRLNVREWEGPNPVRIVIDPELALDKSLHVYDQSQLTLCYNDLKEEVRPNLTFVQFPRGTLSWSAQTQYLLDDLHRRSIRSLFVEGGAQLLSFLIERELWDEARVFRAPIFFNQGLKRPTLNDQSPWAERAVGNNKLILYQRK